MKWRLVFAAIAVTLFSATSTAGSLLTVDVGGIASWDAVDDADNVVLMLQLAPGATITGLGWDVDITPVGDSWYSEAAVLISDSAGGQGIELRPGILDASAGNGVPMSYTSGGIIDLSDSGLDDLVLADGILRLEFYEVFDDLPDTIDANWSGTLSIQAVPIPAGVWLLASALIGLAGWRKRAQ